MGVERNRIFHLVLMAAAVLLAQIEAVDAEAEVLVLVGGTVVDTGDWGQSTVDIEDAVVIVEGGEIIEVGRRNETVVPSGAGVIDVSGKFIVPGLVDGFAAINNQAYANAYLASGVTSIISVDGGRRGGLFLDADPGPRIHRLDSVGYERATLEEHLEATDRLAEVGEGGSRIRLADIVVVLGHACPDCGLFVGIAILPMALADVEERSGGTRRSRLCRRQRPLCNPSCCRACPRLRGSKPQRYPASCSHLRENRFPGRLVGPV